jgi:hypothetical protein
MYRTDSSISCEGTAEATTAQTSVLSVRGTTLAGKKTALEGPVWSQGFIPILSPLPWLLHYLRENKMSLTEAKLRMTSTFFHLEGIEITGAVFGSLLGSKGCI